MRGRGYWEDDFDGASIKYRFAFDYLYLETALFADWQRNMLQELYEFVFEFWAWNMWEK